MRLHPILTVLHNALAAYSASLAEREICNKTEWSRKMGRPRHLIERMQSIGSGGFVDLPSSSLLRIPMATVCSVKSL